MTAKDFAEQFNVSKRYAELILSGQRTVGKNLAEKL
jgi:hypothetical protein